jgi:hypothetical protein
MYSSSRLVTLCLSVVVFPPAYEFEWGEVGEGLVWTDAVVGSLPEEFLIKDGQLVRVGSDLGKLSPPNVCHADTLPSVTNHSERAHGTLDVHCFSEAIC